MYQKLIVVGNIGSDAELNYTKKGTAVTHFSLAVNKGGDSDEPLWIRVTLWDHRAESLAEYLTRGKKVLVEGKLQPPSVWVDNKGEARASLEMTGWYVTLLSPKESSKPSSEPQQREEEIPF